MIKNNIRHDSPTAAVSGHNSMVLSLISLSVTAAMTLLSLQASRGYEVERA
jgi:hypothetical protein